MKKFNFIYITFILASLFVSCSSGGGNGSGGGDDDDPTGENSAPGVVGTLTFPTNNLLCTNNTLEFLWSAASDPDGDSVSYILEISQDDQFGTIDFTETSNTSFKSVTLEKGIIYFWRVKAKDSKGLESAYSQVYQFYTEGDAITNHLPFPPQAINPSSGATVSGASTILEWDASDVDNDPLTYDIYFDTAAEPATKVGEDQSEKTLNVDLQAATTYYWKVVAKDDKGGQSIGQIWFFTTE